MKILYAASNNQSARIQLSRFIGNIGDEHQIKIAAYKTSSPTGLNIDWTLDALLNIYRPDLLSLENDNLSIYYDQVKAFAPDLIVSDLEYFTSYIASLLNVKLWQCSSSLLDYGLKEKYDMGLFKFYAHTLNRDSISTQRIVNLIDNSEVNLVYSHFGDSKKAPELQDRFEWVRPYHQVSKPAIPCQHYAVAGFSTINAAALSVLKKYPDSVVFMEAPTEKYHGVQVKDIRIEDEYYCNLGNSKLFVCQGQASFLADAFYNRKFSVIYPNYEDADSIINSHLSKKLGLGQIVAPSMDVSAYAGFEVQPKYRASSKYLHEKIKELE